MMILAYVLACVVLGAVAFVRARRTNDELSGAYAAIVACVGILAAVVMIRSGHLDAPALVILAVLTISAWTDLSCGYIYDAVLACGAAALAIIVIAAHTELRTLEAATVAFALTFALRNGTSRRALGFGDVKLFVLVGAALASLPLTLESIGASFVAGAIVMLPVLLMRRIERTSKVAFAPFIALGTIAVMSFGAGNL